MSTYSIGVAPTNADKLNNIDDILNKLPDNTANLISPKDIRDASYTLWLNSAFKDVNISGTSISYIGIDEDDRKKTILFGKKKVSNSNILNEQLLNSDTDIFFYNTKEEPQSNYDTKISILSGTSSFFGDGIVKAPYITSKKVNYLDGDNMSLEIGNDSYYFSGATAVGGDINIISKYGGVGINGVMFQTVAENIDEDKNGYVLKYRYNSGSPLAIWEPGATNSVSDLSSDTVVTINAPTVLLNGLNINFTDSNIVPTTIGGINAGETFSNVPVTELLRKLLYTYIAPNLTLSLNRTVIETGDAATNVLNYAITKNSTYSVTNLSVTQGSFSGTLINPATITNGTTNGNINVNVGQLSTTVSNAAFMWNLSISDNKPTTVNRSISMNVVLPIYYGAISVGITTSTINNYLGIVNTNTIDKLTPLIANPITNNIIHNKVLSLSTQGLSSNQGYLYFMYPSSYPDVENIYDGNGFDVTSSFNKYIISGIQSPLSRWAGRTYKVYVFVASGNTPSITSVPNGVNFTFTFA